jgi:oxygen-independent coproporphyrinogen-3 oxidase
MSGIYLHIPFCKQACHYCDFHFSTSRKHKDTLLEAMRKELVQRSSEAAWGRIDTVYFGGGTPSLLSPEEIKSFLTTIQMHYELGPEPEITLEANPDDLTKSSILNLAESPINRLSIGIQSFRETELRWMNRAHSATEAINCLEQVSNYFENYSIDLIYGIPGSTTGQWEETLQQALAFDPPHISAYALTVEPATALHTFIEKGVSPNVDEAKAERDFLHLMESLQTAGYVHYEISNFGKPGYFSKNNCAYWKGVSYMGIGPSAHSYDGSRRRWNVANNIKYFKAIEGGMPYYEIEQLSQRDRYNEAVMTGLRTIWGVPLPTIREAFGPRYEAYLLQQAEPYLKRHLLFLDGDTLFCSRGGKFLVDGMASDLFMINLT